jgi:nitrite reductase/ring-hydroxylating ferredoxin subunit
MLDAPAVDSFAPYPPSWYLLCRVKDLRRGPVTKQIWGREVTAFRTERGQIAVLDARCSHMGADLGKGRVVDESIQCPYHRWQYGIQGKCLHIPAQEHIPAFARQKNYPLAIRHGYVFVFHGAEPLFELPFFPEARPEDFAASRPLRFVGECPWYLFGANSFDAQHWRGVHHRQLHGEPRIDCPHPCARRTRFRALVTGNSIYDRLLRQFAGDVVDVSITNWGGTYMLVTGTFRRAKSYMLVMTQPRTEVRLQVDVLVFARRSKWLLGQLLAEPVSLWLRRLFTRGFMAGEFHELAGIRYNPDSLIDSDRDMIEYFRWAAALPRSATDSLGEGDYHEMAVDADGAGHAWLESSCPGPGQEGGGRPRT